MRNPSASHRFRLQFGLGTMLLAVTIFSLWLGWELQSIRQRRAFLALLERQTAADTAEADGRQIYLVCYAKPATPAKIPLWRSWLGDSAQQGIVLPANMSIDEARSAVAIFPEAVVVKCTLD